MLPDYITRERLDHFIQEALSEDHGDGDHSSLGSIPENSVKHAQLIVKDDGILAGVELAKLIFSHVSTEIHFEQVLTDGSTVSNEDIAFRVSGDARQILGTERIVLNCMQRMSGIATYTHYLSGLIKGTNAKLLDTRKTTPNFRLVEKWAVLIGGGVNHRYGLFDMILLKDNHVDYCGGIEPALNSVKEYLEKNEKQLKIEIEVRNLRELDEVLELGGVHRILLDNMLPSDMKTAINMVAGNYETEASGGITEKNIREMAETGVDFISVGALTHSYKSLDMSLKALKK